MTVMLVVVSSVIARTMTYWYHMRSGSKGSMWNGFAIVQQTYGVHVLTDVRAEGSSIAALLCWLVPSLPDGALLF